MHFEDWEAFAKFAHSSIRFYFDEDHTLATYLENLTQKESNAIGEIRDIVNNDKLHIDKKIRDITDHNRKIVALKSNLFETRFGINYYIPDELPLTGESYREIIAATRLFQSVQRLEGIFAKEQEGMEAKQHDRSITYKKGGRRIPSRASFELANKATNLRAVHKHLTGDNHSFISSSYDDFESAFSGNPVTNKVVWKNLNALHYFIDKIHGTGISRANEGQWERASRCFKVLDRNSSPRNFTADEIKDANDIASTTTAYLDEAIALFLK